MVWAILLVFISTGIFSVWKFVRWSQSLIIKRPARPQPPLGPPWYDVPMARKTWPPENDKSA